MNQSGSVRFCQACGAELPMDAQFCPRCGKKVAALAPSSPATSSPPAPAKPQEPAAATQHKSRLPKIPGWVFWPFIIVAIIIAWQSGLRGGGDAGLKSFFNDIFGTSFK